jgi:hypothetical protein
MGYGWRSLCQADHLLYNCRMPPVPLRHRWSFSLRTMFVVVTGIACSLAAAKLLGVIGTPIMAGAILFGVGSGFAVLAIKNWSPISEVHALGWLLVAFFGFIALLYGVLVLISANA